jgi:DNA-binding SARP family transcriptional activator
MRLRTRPRGRGMALTGRDSNLARATSVPASAGPDPAFDSARVTPMPRNLAGTEFTLHLFGGPSLLQGESPISLSPMEGLLLGFLGAHGHGGASRERACELLWSDGTRADRRQRLAQLLLSTRRKAREPRLIDCEGPRMRLDDHFVQTDVEDFDSSVGSSDFSKAIDLLERGFLSDVAAELTQPLQEWLADYRVALRGRIRTRLAEAVHEVDRRASFDEVAELARLQLRVDPLDEEHLRRLLRARAIRGRIHEAKAEMRLFEERARVLDPHWEPEEETAEVVGGLDLIRLSAPSIASLRIDDADPLLPTEQLRALELLESLIAALATHRSSAFVGIDGPAGSGKSYLLRRVARRAVARGLKTTVADGTRLSVRRLAEELDGGPSVITIDDADDASPDKQDVLVQLFLENSSRGLLVVCVFGHPFDFDHGDPTSENRTPEGPDFFRIRLGPLRPESLDIICAQALGLEQPSETSLAIATLARGNGSEALRLVDLFRGFGDAGAPDPDRAIQYLTADALGGLTGQARCVINICAALRRPTNAQEVAEMAGLREMEVLSTCSELSRLGWMYNRESGFTMGSELLARLVRECVATDDRLDINSRIADSLSRRGGDDASDQVLLVHHLAEAGRASEAADHLLAQLSTGSASLEASPLLDLGDRLLHMSLSVEYEYQLACYMGLLHLRAGRPEKAVILLKSGLAAGRIVGASHVDTARFEVALTQGLAESVGSEATAVAPGYRELRRRLAANEQWELCSELLRSELRSLDRGNVGDSQAALFGWMAAQVPYDSTDEELRRKLPIALMFCSQLKFGRSTAASQLLDRLVSSQCASPSDTGSMTEALQLRFFSMYHEGTLNTDAGIIARQALLTVARSQTDPIQLARQHLNSAVWYLDTFDTEAAAVAISHAQEQVGALCPRPLRDEFIFNRGELLLLEGEYLGALEAFSEGYVRHAHGRETVAGVLFAAGMSATLMRLRRRDEAARVLPLQDPLWGCWSADLSLLMRAHGDVVRDRSAAESYVTKCEGLVEALKGQSIPWYLKAVIESNRFRRRHQFRVDRDLTQAAADLARTLRLPSVATALLAGLRG